MIVPSRVTPAITSKGMLEYPGARSTSRVENIYPTISLLAKAAAADGPSSTTILTASTPAKTAAITSGVSRSRRD